ncbi:TlpA family protein disulfide reductase [Shewanella maritima]|uniref:TlpA family protein disulfide reductase n=1 Tax=Shewanella maritima TaxID=2520507 RepID=UPI003734E258
MNIKTLALLGFILMLPISVIAKPGLSFTLQDRQGEPVTLEQFKGQVVYVDFWSSWCAPCQQAFPWMAKMHDKYQQQGLTIVAINLDVAPELADQFLLDFPSPFTVVYDPDSTVAKAFDLQGMPSSFIFNKQGQLVGRHVGFELKDVDQYEAFLQALLAQ